MRPLPIQIIRSPSSVVDIPFIAEIVELRGPIIAASRIVIGRIDDLRLAILQTVDAGRPGDLHIRPCRRQEVVVSARVDETGIAASGVSDRVGECGGEGPEGEDRLD